MRFVRILYMVFITTSIRTTFTTTLEREFNSMLIRVSKKIHNHRLQNYKKLNFNFNGNYKISLLLLLLASWSLVSLLSVVIKPTPTGTTFKNEFKYMLVLDYKKTTKHDRQYKNFKRHIHIFSINFQNPADVVLSWRFTFK